MSDFMENLRDRINFITKEFHLVEEDFQLVRLSRYKQTLNSIHEKFTNCKETQINKKWWWSSFLSPIDSFCPDDVFESLSLLINENETVWFVIEDERKVHEHYWLYEGKIRPIIKVLNELSFEEYYVVSKKLDWIICENHHNFLIGSGESIVEKMKFQDKNSDKIKNMKH